MTPRRLVPTLLALVLGFGLLADGARAGEELRLIADVFDGRSRHASWEIVVESGRIVSAGPAADASSPGGGERFASPALLTPGFTDLDARGGLDADAELPEIVSPDLLLADAFAPDPVEIEALRRSGVTSAWLLGSEAVVIAGASAVVQPAPAGEPPVILRKRWGCSASLASAARQPERAPTSLPEQALALEATAPSVEGPLRIRFDDGASARHAAALGIPVGSPAGDGDASELRAASALVLSRDWASLRPDEAARLARLIAASPEPRVGIGSGTSLLGPEALRLAAARLLEAGAAPDALLRALTSDAAAILGDDSRGTLKPGAVADLVLWSGDPVLPGSRPLRVWVAGKEIHRAP